MKLFILLILSIFIDLTIYSQIFSSCKVMQFNGEDSLKKIVVKNTNFDKQGRITEEKYKGFKESYRVGMPDATYSYIYQDSLLILKTFVGESNDTVKTRFEYAKNGLLKTEFHSVFEKRLKKNINKGNGKSRGCRVKKKDFEKKKSWYITSIINYKYNSNSNKIESYAPKIHWDRQNKYVWKYDNLNRISEHNSYEDSILIWKETFSYSDTSYKFSRTWYDYNGEPNHLKEKKWEYWPCYTFTYNYDKQGRIIEENVVNEKGEMLNRKTTEYNRFGLILKTIKYNSDNLPDITHIYEYKK